MRNTIRCLAAILAADVAGIATERGERKGTRERPKALRRELVAPKITEHHGCIADPDLLFKQHAIATFAS